jgi:hypothetical protein
MAAAGSFLLGTRARVMGYAFAALGMVATSPSGSRSKTFASFLMEPGGAMIMALALVLLGISVEETGTMPRIRAGIALRLAAAAAFVVMALWAGARGSASPSASTLGWTMIAMGGALVAYGAFFDLAAWRDPRHGQSLQLEKVSPEGLILTAEGRRVRIPVADITGVAVAPSTLGRAVVISVRSDAGHRHEGDALPWIMAGVDADQLVLTEHQAGLDATLLATRIQEAAQAARGFR